MNITISPTLTDCYPPRLASGLRGTCGTLYIRARAKPAFLTVVIAVAGVETSVLAQGGWTVTSLNPAGGTFSVAYAAPSGTQQAGVAVIGTGGPRASLWNSTAASWINLNPASAEYSEIYSSSGTRQAGYARVSNADRASMWIGTAASWVNLNPAGASESRAYGAAATRQVGFARLGGANRAGLWSGTAASWVSIHPAGATASVAFAASATQQVGTSLFGTTERAGLWNGTAASWVSLHPAVGAGSFSAAYCTTGTQQGGLTAVGGTLIASLWSGTAASWVNLNPAGAADCYVSGMFGTQQVGSANVGDIGRASLWTGTAASWEDLSLALTGSWGDTVARGIWSDGSFTYVVGEGINNATGNLEALLWKRPNTPLCLADVVQDNVIDGTDFIAFINSFGVGDVAVDAAADVAGGGANGLSPDGIIDGSDFVAFINAFSAGC